jgi:hypothetical protein
MKLTSRALLAGVGAAAALALATTPALASSAPAATSVSDFCQASTSGSTVTGNCTTDTPFGTFGATFSGTFGSDGYGSGTITFQGGPVGDMNGTWTGGPFTGGPATINYTVQSPAGPISGSFEVPSVS